MRYLGIDYGSSYLGLAVGDSDSFLSLPYDTIAEKDLEQQLLQIESIIADEQIDSVVVGFPLTLEGTESPQTEKTLSFINELSGKIGIPVEREDERLTSKLGATLQQEFPGGKYDDHALAATSILQVFLDRLKG